GDTPSNGDDINLLFEHCGCGIIATNDVLLYLRNGVSSYRYFDSVYMNNGNATESSFYYDEAMSTYSLFPNLLSIGYCFPFPQTFIATLIADFFVDLSAPVLFPETISFVLYSQSYSNSVYHTSSTTRDTMLEHIITSLRRNYPVILCEFDVENMIRNLDRDVRSQVGFPMYMLWSNETGCPEVNLDESNVMTDHYVTITGVFIDNQSGRTWLRVQTWGSEYYLDFDEFYSYSNDNAESFINRDGAIIVIG
ncbi:MAG TPA: hypothetical protein PLE82_07465, partial [Saccharofermentans sp.]|nr:hypothetical protein [Saccharofermentans sp.]